MDPLIGTMAFLATAIMSRMIREKALKTLSTDEKASLVDAFSSFRIYTFVSVLALMVIFYLCLNYLVLDQSFIFIGYGVCLVIFLLVSNGVVYRSLRKLQLPDRYIKSYILSSLIQLAGFGFLFFPIVTTFS